MLYNILIKKWQVLEYGILTMENVKAFLGSNTYFSICIFILILEDTLAMFLP